MTLPGVARRSARPAAQRYADDTDPQLRRTAIALFAAGIATFASLYSTQALLPLLSSEFGLSAGQAALSLSIATAGIAVGLLIAGPLSDVVGRTVVMHGSLIVSAVLGVACVAAPTWTALLALRAAQGVALAGLPAVAAAYLREEVDSSAYPQIMGQYIAGTAIGGMSGRLITAALSEVGGWRGALGGVAAVAVTCLVLTRVLLPASRHFRPTRPSPGEVFRAWGQVLRDPVLLALYGIAGTLMGAFVAIYNVMGFRLVGPPYHLPVGLAGMVFALYAFGSLGSAVGGRWAAGRGQREVVPAGAALTAVGITITALHPLPGVIAGLVVMTFGFFVAHGVTSGWVAARAHRHGATAQATALYLLAFYTGSSLAGALAGGVWSRHGWPGVVDLTVVLALFGVALALFAGRAAAECNRGTEPRSIVSGILTAANPVRHPESS